MINEAPEELKRQRIKDHRSSVERLARKKAELEFIREAWEAIRVQCSRLGVSVQEFADAMQTENSSNTQNKNREMAKRHE